MKIALLQCNPVNGDLAGNAARILELAEHAAHAGAQLCVTPACALAGVSPGQYMLAPEARPAAEDAMRDLAVALASGPALLLGAPGGVCLLRGGGIMRLVGSMPGKAHIFCFDGQDLGIILGMESWPGGHQTPDLIIRMLSEPYAIGSPERLATDVSSEAARLGVVELAVNAVGGNDGRILAGQSIAADCRGRVFGRAASFAEDILLADCGSLESTLAPLPDGRQGELWAALTVGLADFSAKCGVGRALLGLSGGLDSSLVACVAVDALGADNVLGVLMPSPHTSRASLDDAMTLAGHLGLRTVTVPIAPLMSAFDEAMAPAFAMFAPGPGDTTAENIQARIRGCILACMANRAGALVLNTGNKSETAMGYCTLYGDTVGALGVIADLTKTQVRGLARWLNGSRGREVIPLNVITRPPSAELAPGQKDEDSLPPYEMLDPALDAFLRNPDGANQLFAERGPGSPRSRLYASEFKRRQAPPALVVSDCPFGALWRVPICGRLTVPGQQ